MNNFNDTKVNFAREKETTVSLIVAQSGRAYFVFLTTPAAINAEGKVS